MCAGVAIEYASFVQAGHRHCRSILRHDRCGLFKPFHGERPLPHPLHESCVGVIADNLVELSPVVSHHAGTVNDHVVDKPIAGVILQPKIQRSIDLGTNEVRPHLGKAALAFLKEIEDLLTVVLVDPIGNGISQELNEQADKFLLFRLA